MSTPTEDLQRAADNYQQAKDDLHVAHEELKKTIKTTHAQGLKTEELIELSGFGRTWLFALLERNKVWVSREPTPESQPKPS